ncbi:MAG: hypothetical protein ACE5JR_10480 [Gemmatimonadota bacterium]
MPPFIASILHWASVTGRHFGIMFWWVWLSAVVATAVSESFLVEGRLRRLLERPTDGWRTVWLAAQFGVLSPPSRSRIFRQAKELLARGVSPAGVMAYLVSAQSLLIWMLFFIVGLDGPQPMIGQLVAVGTALAVLSYGLRRTPERLWELARQSAAQGSARSRNKAPIARRGPVWARLGLSAGGQVYSLWWPMLFGLVGIGFFLALGQSSAYLSLQGAKGPLVQLGNGGVGLLAAYVTGAPLVGNALFAAGLWKPEFVTYAGLSAFYLGTLVMPFVFPRYLALLGVGLGKQVLGWLIVAILAGALAATAWWWGLDWLAGVLGVRESFEALTHSTLRPNDVPWFHHWFQPSGMGGM